MSYFLKVLYDEYSAKIKVKDDEIKELEITFNEHRTRFKEAKSKYDKLKEEVT